MQRTKEELWEHYKRCSFDFPAINLSLDLSRLDFDESFFAVIEKPMQRAFSFMAELERGAIANPDEKRMVGHYWLRNPALAPSEAIRQEIESTIKSIKQFAGEVHAGKVKGAGGLFSELLLIGIGGSALGPQFVSHALGQPGRDKLRLHTFDNTDPDGMDRTFAELGPSLSRTLCVVVSKSGSTKETRNGMLETEAAFSAAGLNFAKQAVAITEAGSDLDERAKEQGWLACFPMWNWVGGRTSETSAVGLVPAALQGFDIDQLLDGAKTCDELTRQSKLSANPSALLAAMWYSVGEGTGKKAMVILPYKDRLEFFSKYLQQLVMESLGKKLDLNDRVIHQGFTVYGNKGSTDQHAYVQQLRDGEPNFFVTFIKVLQQRFKHAIDVETDITSGDYLTGFLLGTREALYESGRQSLTITIEGVNAFTTGVLIALFERTVGLYAQLINVNAYNQPGVEAGKKAAAGVIEIQRRVLAYLREKRGHALTSDQIASGIGAHGDFETVHHICRSLAADGRLKASSGDGMFACSYELV